jgi:hypothetical protein
VVFNRHHSKEAEEHESDHSELVELLLGADEIERKRLLLLALQTGELRKSEAAELLRLVDRLEALSDSAPARAEPGIR